MDQLKEMLTDVIDAREGYTEQSMNKKALELDDQYWDICNEIGERKQFRETFAWCNRAEGTLYYEKPYITVYVLWSQVDADDFVDTIYTLGLGGQIMYPKEEENGDGTYVFDCYEGEIAQALQLSIKMPEAVILVVDNRNPPKFDVYKNGEVYPEFVVKWIDGEPEPYQIEDEDEYGVSHIVYDETLYDFAVKVTIMLPCGEEFSISFGGTCTGKDKEYYDNLTSIFSGPKPAPKQPNLVISIDQLRNETTRQSLRNMSLLSDNIIIKIIDESLPYDMYWLAEYEYGNEGITLTDEAGTHYLSWGYTDEGEYVVNCGEGMFKEEPKALRTICTEKATYFEQLLEFSDTHVIGPFGVTAVGKYATA